MQVLHNFSVVRAPSRQVLPWFKSWREKAERFRPWKVAFSERFLIEELLGHMQRIDPDVLVNCSCWMRQLVMPGLGQ
jgi:hypothetical protein